MASGAVARTEAEAGRVDCGLNPDGRVIKTGLLEPDDGVSGAGPMIASILELSITRLLGESNNRADAGSIHRRANRLPAVSHGSTAAEQTRHTPTAGSAPKTIEA
jgi:hypothetical protein